MNNKELTLGSLFSGSGGFDLDGTEAAPIFDGLYWITRDGRLYSSRSHKFLRQDTDRYGYSYYVISINSVRHSLKAHRLVAEAFIPNPEKKPTVNHKNGVRNDNRVDNLEWATYVEQSADPLTTLNRNRVVAHTDYRKMAELGNCGRRKTAVYRDGILQGVYPSLKIAVAHHPANLGKASECANGKRKKAGGVQFCYV